MKNYVITFNGKFYSMKQNKFVDNLKEATIQTKSFFIWCKKNDSTFASRTLNSDITKIKK